MDRYFDGAGVPRVPGTGTGPLGATLLTALPFLGIVKFELGLGYETLKFLHILFVIIAISILIDQLIAFNVMQHAKITTPKALEYLSRLDHAIPVCLVIIAVLGYSMAGHYGPFWEVEWIHEAAFGLLIYTFCGLVMTVIFRRIRFQHEGGTQSPAGVYLASGIGIGIVFLVFISALMIYKSVPLRTADSFIGIAKYFSDG